MASVPNFGKVRHMFDKFDLKLLNAVQEDADRTAEQGEIDGIDTMLGDERP